MITVLPAYAPVRKTNSQRAKCARCHRKLLPGTGTAWQMLDQLTSNRLAYLCRGCSIMQATEELSLMLAAEALDVIGLHLGWTRPLGWVDEQRVRGAIRAAGAQGAENAIRAARRIGQGERLNVWEIVAIIKNS